MDSIQLIYLVPLLPLVGFLINGLARNVLSKSLVSIIGCGVVLGSFIVSLFIFFQVNHEGFTAQTISYFDFINTGKILEAAMPKLTLPSSTRSISFDMLFRSPGKLPIFKLFSLR